jgi:nicotinate-nucleotide adenylyltransferase
MHRLGVLGGTFDPIHVGHLVAASEALHTYALDRVLFVPAGDPWQKTDYSNPEDRFLMTSLAAGLHPRFAASRIEIDRKGPSYTVDTVVQLADFYPDLEIFLIMGADALKNLPTWHEVERLAGMAEIIAVTRNGVEADETEHEGLPKVHRLDIPAIGVSSTDVRRRVRTGAPIDFLVPMNVAEFIAERGLYVGEASR